MLKTLKGKTIFSNIICIILTICLLVFQFIPFWNYGNDSISINGYIWLDTDNEALESWFRSQLGETVNINSIVLSAVLILLFGIVGIILMLMKHDNGYMAIFTACAALSGIYAFAFKPVFRLGDFWIIQLILCIAILIASTVSIITGIRKNKQEALDISIITPEDINARVAAIKALGEKKEKNFNQEDENLKFNKLLNYLTDEIPECRIAAAEALSTTTREPAITHLCHLVISEKDEKVVKAMRSSLASIRNNIKNKESANA